MPRKDPWRGMHWLILSALASAVMDWSSAVMLWAWKRERAARVGLD